VKAASLVEFNADDYVSYLNRVYRDAPAATLQAIAHWGKEEIQHGLALGRWAEMADPLFDFQAAFARFQSLYRPAHFDQGRRQVSGSVRGSRRGEMIARCVVESGTSSLYSAIRDAAEEPVLKEVAGRIAADEFRHYQLFFSLLQGDPEPDLPLWRKLFVAFTRVNESSDDELACAYYCANVPPQQAELHPYRRRIYAQAYSEAVMAFYRRHHIDRLVKMVVKPAGLNPKGWLSRLASALLWRVLCLRGRTGSGPLLLKRTGPSPA
jgi:hypothetical protein